jgi:hypothetical protein
VSLVFVDSAVDNTLVEEFQPIDARHDQANTCLPGRRVPRESGLWTGRPDKLGSLLR